MTSADDLCGAVQRCGRPRGHRGHHGGFRRLEDRTTELTPRQRELVLALAKGLTWQAAGYELGISLHTVKNYRAALIERLGLQNPVTTIELLAAVGWLRIPASRSEVAA